MLKSGLQRRLLESHLVIALAGVVCVFVLFLAAAFIGRSADRLSDSVGPLPHAVLSLTNGLQSSIAANHGWVYLGDTKFIDMNQKAWVEIDGALTNLKAAQTHNAHLFSAQDLSDIESIIAQISDLQAGISYVPQPLARPPLDIYEQDIAPVKREIDALFEGAHMLNREYQHPLVAESLAGLETRFTESVLQLELAIKSREQEDTDKFQHVRRALLSDVAQLPEMASSDAYLLSQVVLQLREALGNYLQLADQSLLNHRAKYNTQIREFLFDSAVPLTNGVIFRLQNLEKLAADEVSRYREEMRTVTRLSLIGAFVAFVGLVIAAVVISINNARALLGRLSALSRALQNFSDHDVHALLDVQGTDEISSLSRMFNHMVSVIHEKHKTVMRYQNELEDRVASRTRELFKSRELSETALRSIGDALITVNAEGVITRFNPSAERLLDVPASEAIGLPVAVILVFENADDAHVMPCQPVDYCIRSQQVFSPEEPLYLYQSVNKKVAVKISAAPIGGENGTVDGAIVIIRDVTKEQELQNELSYRANHDMLTGLANRGRFNQHMQLLLERVKQHNNEHVLVFLDLDKFKNVNDTAGHAAGDELLRQLSRLLRDSLRSADVLARLGGDEFAIILRDCSVNQGRRVCEKLRKSVADFRFVWNEQSFQVGVSIGLVGVAADSPSLSVLLRRADAACYAAKNAGRNRVHVAQPEDIDLQEKDQADGRTDTILRQIDHHCALLDVQSLHRTSTDEDLVFYKAVLLLGDTDHPIPAHQYQPVVERYKYTEKLDLLALEKVLAVLSPQHPDAGLSDAENQVPVIVPLSGESLAVDAFLDATEELLMAQPPAQGRLIFSIAENALQQHRSRISEASALWQRWGIDIMLDKFSAGLATLSGLDTLPIKYLKLDHTLTRDLGTRAVQRRIVASVRDIAHLSGKAVVVHAEDAASLEVLSQFDIDYVIAHSQSVPTTALTPSASLPMARQAS